uniref:Uncharacterized protein n=1 Tax=Brassica oleracea var. oleracea TaxID=109376 RepID=A0A0D3DAM0_BRAOL
MYMSKASHLIVVPCDVFEAESPITPDKSIHLSSYSGALDDPLHAEASQRGLIFRSEVDTGPTESVSNDINKPGSIDTTTSTTIDNITPTSIDTHRVSEQKEYDVCQNLFDGGTITRSDKSRERRGGIGRRGKESREIKKKVNCNDGTVAALSDTVARKSSDTVAKNIERHCSKNIDRHCSRKSGVTPSTDETMSTSIDITSSTTIYCHFIVSIDTDISEQDFLDVDCNIADVMILSFKSCESLLFSNLFQRDCPSVLLKDNQNADVIHVLLKSGQSASREEAVEEMQDCRLMKQHWGRPTVISEYGLSIF